MVRPLKQWLLRHRHNPYPTKAEKAELAAGSNMTLIQVSNWFANARRRLKNVVQDPRCSWSARLRMYNQFVQGNAELLSIASDDSIWNSNDEEEEGEEGGEDEEEDDDIDVVDCSDEEAKAAKGVQQSDSKYKKSMLQRFLSDSYQQQQQHQQHRRTNETEKSDRKRKREAEADEACGDDQVGGKRAKPGAGVVQPKAVLHRPFAPSAAPASQMLLPLPLLPPLSLLPPPLLAMRAMAALPPPPPVPPAASQPLPSTLRLLSELSAFSSPAASGGHNQGRRAQEFHTSS